MVSSARKVRPKDSSGPRICLRHLQRHCCRHAYAADIRLHQGLACFRESIRPAQDFHRRPGFRFPLKADDLLFCATLLGVQLTVEQWIGVEFQVLLLSSTELVSETTAKRRWLLCNWPFAFGKP